MRKFFLSVVLSICVLSLAAQSKDEQAIRRLMAEQEAAWNKGDLEGFMQGYWKSDRLLFVGQKGPEYGWEFVLQNYKKSYPTPALMGKLTFDLKEIRFLNKKNAFVLGAWKLTRERDTPAGFFTLLFQKIGGQWVIVADHSS